VSPQSNPSLQLKATTEITLYVEDSQIPHVQSDDPKVIWDKLARIHRSHGLSTQLAAMRKFSRMEKHPDQSISSWISDIKAQVHLIKDIGITLSNLFVIVVLTSGLPAKFDSVVVALDSIESKSLTFEVAISRLLNEEEHHLSRKLMEDYKTSLVKGEIDITDDATVYAARVGKPNVVCFKYGKKGHYVKGCAEEKKSANHVDEEPDGVW
jgi:ribosomal protein L35AE/L33A